MIWCDYCATMVWPNHHCVKPYLDLKVELHLFIDAVEDVFFSLADQEGAVRRLEAMADEAERVGLLQRV